MCVCVCVCAREIVCVCVYTHTHTHTNPHIFFYNQASVPLYFKGYVLYFALLLSQGHTSLQTSLENICETYQILFYYLLGPG